MACLSPQLGDSSFDLLSKSSLSAEGSNEAIVKRLTAGEPGDSLIPACVRLAGKESSVAKGAGQKQISSHISKVLA